MTVVASPGTATTDLHLRPVYTLVEAAGLAFVALTPLTFIVLALIAGVPIASELPFFGGVVAITAVAAALVWRFGTWANIVGIVAVLLAAFAMFWAAFGLAYPASFGDFTPAVLFVLGVALGIGGGVAALVQRRRGHLESSLTRAERRVLVVALAVAAAAALGSGAANLVARSAAAGEAGVAVAMHNFEFAEAAYTVPAGEAMTIAVTNSDPWVHSFTVPALGVDVTVLPGSTETIELTAPPGTYTLYCRPHSDMNEPDPTQAGMAAQLIAN